MGKRILLSWIWRAWVCIVAAAMIWAARKVPDVAPPSREAFEERHRIAYDVYAAADNSHAYDLLAAAFAGEELDRQYGAFAKACSQLNKTGANVIVWDLQYQDFKVVSAHGDRCSIYSKWAVVYVLGHSQHSHVRSNAYEAVFELVKEPDGWRIESSSIVNENILA